MRAIDGWNAGFYELAGAGEICAYFDAVMCQQLLPTGRVSYFPMSEYTDGRFRTLAGEDVEVDVKRRCTSTARVTGWAAAARSRSSLPVASRCGPCAPASPCSAPRWSHTWRRRSRTTR